MSIAQAVTHICENFVGRQRSARGRFACADFIGGFDIISDESGNCSGTIVSESEALSYSFFRRAGADAVLKKLGDVIAEFCSRKTSMGASETLTGSGLAGDIYILFSTGATTGTSLKVTGGSVIHSSNAGYSRNNGAIWTIRSTAKNISVTIKADDKTLMRLTRQ